MQSWKYYPPKSAPDTRMMYLSFLCDELETGKVTNDPADKGGLTKWGITLPLFQDYLVRKKNLVEFTGKSVRHALLDLTKDQAISIYGAMFYEPYKELPERVAIFICDMAINNGPKMAATVAQTAYNKNLHNTGLVSLKEDGAWGPKTLQALIAFCTPFDDGASVLINVMRDLRMLHTVDICVADPSQLKFLAGWMLRSMRFRA